MDTRLARTAADAMSAAAQSAEAETIRAGTPAFRRTNLAMLCAGFSTFALLYCVQPLLPAFSRQFHVAPAEASMALSVSTVLLAVSLLAAGSLSEAWGRKPMMVAAMVAAALLNVLTAVMPAWHGVLMVRALEGIALSGLPAIAMAYLSEEMHPRSVSLAMGLYVSGSGLGGLAGRLLTAVLTDLTNWRFAVATLGGWVSSPPPSSPGACRPHATSGRARCRRGRWRAASPGISATAACAGCSSRASCSWAAS